MDPQPPSTRKPALGKIVLLLGILAVLVLTFLGFKSFNPSDQVAALTPQPGGYDLAAFACQAIWYYPYATRSLGGNRALCASRASPESGLVLPLETARLSSGETVGPLIWIEKPAEIEFLAAEYPAYAVQPGDHFTARLGCSQDQPHCSSAVAISFIVHSRHIAEKETWLDVSFDQPPVDVDIDLSDLAGKLVVISWNIFSSIQDDSLCQLTVIAPRIGP